jgi:hypothetical protein
MSWSDFTHAMVFGGPIFRPYSDWLADVQAVIHNIFASEPDLGRFAKLLHERDVLFIRGQAVSVVILSSGTYRHLPSHYFAEWDEFFALPERARAEFSKAEDQAIQIVDRDLLDRVEREYHLTKAIVVAFPSLFSISAGSTEDALRIAAVRQTAVIIANDDRARFVERNSPKEIFLSHKTVDKPLVREIAETLTACGLAPWLDEDKMPAGVPLERALLDGFKGSCAAVFFVTKDFKDERFLATEIDYSLAEWRTKGDRFSIVTLVLSEHGGVVPNVPELLRRFVFKEVRDVQIIRQIVLALPIKLGSVVWKTPGQ